MLSDLATTWDALGRLRRRIPFSRGHLGVALLLLLVGGGLEGATIGLMVPLLTMLTGSSTPSSFSVFDGFLSGMGLGTKVLVLGIGIVLVNALKNALTYAGLVVASNVRKRAVVELRRQLLEAVLHAAPTTLERYTSGEITGVLTTEAWRVNRILDQILSIVQKSIVVASYFAAILFLSWHLTLVTLVLGVVLGVVSQWLAQRALRHGRELTAANLRLSRQITETVGGARVIQTTASQKPHREAFDRHSGVHADSDVGASLSQSQMFAATETLGIAGAMVLTALAYVFWLKPGNIDAPTFLAFGFGLVRLLPALNMSYSGYGQLMTVVGSLEKVLSWLEMPVYPKRPYGKVAVPKLKEGIRFDDVGFRYGEGKDVLRAMSLFLPVGETLAVLGSSGAGKSTFAALLLRLREPTAGKILFDGTDHWEFAYRDFCQAVAFVEQEPFLFNATIAENVACLLPDVDRATVMAAIERVQLGDFIQTLPNGVDTVLAERGTTLSGGQRQRLAIARAIVRNPQILVLDEPTSALDAETEQEVVKAIRAASVGRTTIIITHRASAVQHANLRLRLETGRVERNAPSGVEGDLSVKVG